MNYLGNVANLDPRLTNLLGKFEESIHSNVDGLSRDAADCALLGEKTKAYALIQTAEKAASDIHGRPVKLTEARMKVNQNLWTALKNGRLIH